MPLGVFKKGSQSFGLVSMEYAGGLRGRQVGEGSDKTNDKTNSTASGQQ
jgi:hypothetical protein